MLQSISFKIIIEFFTKAILFVVIALLGVGLSLIIKDIKPDNTTLVLVVNAKDGDFVQLLKNKKSITLKQRESLYEVTQALWVGSESEFNQQLKPYFKRNSEENPLSDYDVYFVKFKLIKQEIRFNKDVDSLDRLDAFRSLDTNVRGIEVSPRLPSKAYANSMFYNR